MAGTDGRRSNDIGRWLGMQKSGEWRFKMSAKKYAKCVDVSEEDTISDVERKIATTLGVEGKRTKLELKEDNEDVSKTKGQCESRGPDVIVVRVVAKVGRETCCFDGKGKTKWRMGILRAKRGREEELVEALDTDSGGWASD
ncbi:hypothetical protein ISN45_At02g006650 [Arabidopsis thaliana x Arabidopsis arenosa]|uniref:Uncharacterized protein n=1 Tax=Arabidopsis thaliana x Arabidopsis arenosa TaxID=1240361 RepID=A0A8T2FKY4_9BRAS|nr:hypothetical protein ISN45_At02g006650 [Arabidopsis thaliana x Arabidopsis arenosa]